MKHKLLFLALLLAATGGSLFGQQQNFPGSSSGGGAPTTVTSLFPAGKILAEYQFKPTASLRACAPERKPLLPL